MGKINLKEMRDSFTKLSKKTLAETKKFADEKVIPVAKETTRVTIEKTTDIYEETKEFATEKAIPTIKKEAGRSVEKVKNVMDINGDGKVDIEDIIILGLRTPGIRISREDFLRTELKKDFPQDVIDKVVEHNPAYAGITSEQIEKYANSVIQYERNCVSGISAALGTPGGTAIVATIPADIVQYYGYMLRATQKLLYLYGFPEIDVTEKGTQFDTETLNILTLCMGVMYGVAGANNAIKSIAKALGSGVQKQLMKKALTKGTLYPIVKSTAKWFGVKMTKEVFTGFFKKAIPVVGGIVGGTLTYVSFKPCCDKLKNSLEDTLLSNPNHISNEEENIIIDVDINEHTIIDVEE